MTKQEIMDAITGCAHKLGRTPSILEVMKMGQVSRRQIRAEFGSFTQALRECNLERASSSGQKVPLEPLFVDWAAVVRKVGKAPSMSEYEALSKYSCKPLVRCFGSWKQVAYGLTQFAEGRGLAEEWKAELEMAAVKAGDRDAQWMLRREAPTVRSNILAASQSGMPADWRERAQTAGPTAGSAFGPAMWPEPTAGPIYGPPMWPGPLAYAPVNELGVVFLFGWMAPQLGYVVHRIQPEFPDCEAMRRVGEDKCQLIKIEFEHESRNFLKHMHDVKGCDMIICWRHNWPECPLEVLELSREIGRSGNRVIG
jgi:HNH endonuclease